MSTAIAPLLAYPLQPDDEQKAVEDLARRVSLVREKLDSKYGRARLEELLIEGLREGKLSLCIKAVEAADKQKDPIGDHALRTVGAELQTALLQKRDLETGHLQVVAYFQRVGTRPPHKRKPGRYGGLDNFYRNIQTCVLIRLACAMYGVLATRNRESRRADRNPSGCSIVAKALARNRINLDERTIQQEIWFGVYGELIRRIPDATFFAPGNFVSG